MGMLLTRFIKAKTENFISMFITWFVYGSDCELLYVLSPWFSSKNVSLLSNNVSHHSDAVDR